MSDIDPLTGRRRGVRPRAVDLTRLEPVELPQRLQRRRDPDTEDGATRATIHVTDSTRWLLKYHPRIRRSLSDSDKPATIQPRKKTRAAMSVARFLPALPETVLGRTLPV